LITYIKTSNSTKVTAIAHYDEYVREKRLLMLVKRFRDMVFRQCYECEYEEWDSEEDEDGEWEWFWEDEEESQGEQMQVVYLENIMT
jgi:hypothetical protein